jgi:hypothetical protein
MVSLGTPVPTIDLTLTLPKTRKDGSTMAASDIESVTILRNSVDWKTISGPFSGPIKISDSYPATELDTYSFYATDAAGVRSEISAPAKVVLATEPLKAAPSVGTLTAIVQGSAPAPKPLVEPVVAPAPVVTPSPVTPITPPAQGK